MYFFLELMNISKFRRCIFDELIENDIYGGNQSIFIVYSGQIGIQVDGLKDYTKGKYLYSMDVGVEFG